MKIRASNYAFIESINFTLYELALDVERFAFFDSAIAALKGRQFLDAWVDTVIEFHHLIHPGSNQLDDRIQWLIKAEVLSQSMIDRLTRFKALLNQKIHAKSATSVSEHVAKELLDNVYVMGSHLLEVSPSNNTNFDVEISKFKAAQLASYMDDEASTVLYLSGLLNWLQTSKSSAEKKSLRKEISYLFSRLENYHTLDSFNIKYRIYKEPKLELINRAQLIHAARQVLNQLIRKQSPSVHDVDFIYKLYQQFNLKEAFTYLEQIALQGNVAVIRLLQNHYANQKFDQDNVAKYCELGIKYDDPVSVVEHVIMILINDLRELVDGKLCESDYEQKVTTIKNYLSELKAPSENVVMCCESLLLATSTNANLSDTLRLKHLENSFSLVHCLSPWTMIYLAYHLVFQYHSNIRYPDLLVTQITEKLLEWSKKYGNVRDKYEIRELIPFYKQIAGY
ncbi:hypothetical protein [Pseudidiomarina sp. YC-516-91]|uniref:hypothetical protein n=1 Tax=Pseudidiomarina salilacus TaxID=3384452 RepID=UPI003984AC33